MNKINIRLIALFFFSVVLIAYELFVMRVFSVGSWSNFGFLVISTALLGFGLAGTLLALAGQKIKQAPNKWLSFCAIAFLPAMTLSYVVSQAIPFNPILISQDVVQILWVGVFYIIFGIPFFIGALFIGIMFMVFSTKIHKLYFWNMVGSGLGGLVILLFMYLMPPAALIYPLLALSALAALLSIIKYDGETNHYQVKFMRPGVFEIIFAVCSLVVIVVGVISMLADYRITFKVFEKTVFDITTKNSIELKIVILSFLVLAAAAAVAVIVRNGRDAYGFADKLQNPTAHGTIFICCFLLVFVFGGINVSEYKSISYARNYRDTKLVHHSFSPLGETHVYSSSLFHSAPGLSDMAIIELLDNPRQDFLGLYTDGDGPLYIMGKPIAAESDYMEYLPMAAPYRILTQPNVLLVNLNGGISARLGLKMDSRRVTIVEPNPELVRLMKDDPVVSGYTGDLLREDKVSIVREEPRAHCLAHKDTYDLIEISLIDAIGFDRAQGYSIAENFRYTKEAIGEYLGSLKDDGLLSITVWNMLEPPRNVLKLLATIVTQLEEMKVGKPSDHLVAFGLHRSTVTILIKKTSFLPEEVGHLLTFVKNMSFEQIYYPSMPKSDKSFTTIMAYYLNYFSSENMEKLFRPTDLYHLALFEIFEGRAEKLFRDYIFDISPMTDDRPYYSSYLKFDKTFTYLGQPLKVIEEWGFLLILAVFAQSIIFAVLIIAVPLAGRFREFLAEKKRTAKIIVYFSCLGLGYMLMEIFLIQRLVFFLSDPIFSTSIVITSMLVISGLGSLTSARFSSSRTRIVRLAVLAIALTTAFYLFGLTPLLKALLGAHILLKALITIVIIAPAAFFMGMPFPNALIALDNSRPRLLPWAWGMNGALSVTGSVLARLISIPFGFSFVLVFTVLVYAVAGFLFRANER